MPLVSEIAIHHSGGLGNDRYAKTQNIPLSSIESAHKVRFKFPSKLNGSHIGYTFSITPDGKVTQHRFIGEEGAHTIGHNISAVGIHLSGNFTLGVETPTLAQEAGLQNLINALMENKPEEHGLKVLPGTTVNFSYTRIAPHRVWHPMHTECYGTGLPDYWGQQFGFRWYNQKLEFLQKVIYDLQQKIYALLKARSLAGLETEERSCAGHI